LKQIQLKIPEDSNGFHARPASLFVKVAAQFPCEITVEKDEVIVNGKSILGLMMLAMGPGTIFTIIAEGDKEDDAITRLSELVDSNFHG
jgi:phosphocarrier protein HPr